MTVTENKGLDEWRNYWFLPILGALGYATSVLYIYSMGPFIEPIQQEFSWSRAQISSGITITAAGTALFSIPIGALVDRFGPRRIAIFGVIAVCCSVALLGTATGSDLNWVAIWCVLAFATIFVQTTVWASAVNSRFRASRGVALAVTLSGAAFAAAFFPVVASWLIERFGWRTAYFVMAAGWGAIAIPPIILFFRGASDKNQTPEQAQPPETLTGLSVRDGFRSFPLYALVLAGGFFAFTVVGLMVHFIPILTGAGVGRIEAAALAGMIGLFSMVGRLGTGFLLDRLSAQRVGAVVFLFPLVGALILLSGLTDYYALSLAAIMIGLTLGAEVDVIAFLSARYFGMLNYGTLYGAVIGALSIGTAFGPLTAGWFFDVSGDYNQFLLLVCIMVVIASVMLLSLGRAQPFDDTH